MIARLPDPSVATLPHTGWCACPRPLMPAMAIQSATLPPAPPPPSDPLPPEPVPGPAAPGDPLPP